MAHKNEIAKAIGTHGMWKQHLKLAVETGKSDLKVEKVRLGNECEFGRWLESLPAAEQHSEHWKLVQKAHAEFHIEAARVLGLALSGHKADADKALDSNGRFSDLSSDLTKAMMSWNSAS